MPDSNPRDFTRTVEWSAANPGGGRLTGLRLEFAYTRTRFEEVQVRAVPAGQGRPVAAKLETGFLTAEGAPDFDLDLSAAGRIALRIRYSGEHPILTDLAWSWSGEGEPDKDVQLQLPVFAPDWEPQVEGEDKPRLPSSYGVRTRLLRQEPAVDVGPEAGPGPETAGAPGPPQPPTVAEQAQALIDERRLAVEAHFRMTSFFAHLDQLTSPELAPSAAQYNVRKYLLERLYHRQACGAHAPKCRLKPNLTADTDRPALLNNQLIEISDLLRQAFEALDQPADALPHATTPLWPADWTARGLRPLDHAFECFVTGRLAVAHPDPALHKTLQSGGVPDSALFLLFGEFALTCIHNAVEPDYWLDKLAVFVRMTHALTVMFPSSAAGLTPKSFREGRSLPLTWLHELRAAHEAVLGAAAGTPAQLQVLSDALTYFAPLLEPKHRPLEAGIAIAPTEPLVVDASLVDWEPLPPLV